ncbi:MAG: methylmalonyl-CoA mutase [Flavobacteriales bacterium]|nr:methylmalonyl-CoA mutase [Flavobacteriales bacterium]
MVEHHRISQWSLQRASARLWEWRFLYLEHSMIPVPAQPHPGGEPGCLGGLRTDAMSVHRSTRRGAREGGYHPVADRRATKYGRTMGAHPQGCGPAAVALDRGPSWHPPYETLKHTGEYPIIGVNTFLSSKGSPTILPKEVIRATEEEKEAQYLSRLSGIATVENLRAAYSAEAAKAIKDLQQAAIRNENMFEVLMEATKYCSLGQLTAAMFEVGGQYRRNM